MTKKTDLVEFDASAEDSSVPEPVSTGSAKRPADKDGGESMNTLDISKLGKLPSKATMISQMVAKAHRVSKGKLNDRMANIIAAMGSDDIDDGAAASNKASISMKEEVETLFNGKELSEEFKTEASTILEAAVSVRLAEETAKLEEKYEAELTEAIDAFVTEHEERISEYLDAAVAEWVEENALAIESSLKADVVESFLGGLRGLFAEHYIEFPEDKIEVVEALTARAEELEGKANDAINESVELRARIAALEGEKVLKTVTEGMTAVQFDKFKTLAEGVEFVDAEDYSKKLGTIKESFFKEETETKTTTPAELKEEVVTVKVDGENGAPAIDPRMKGYVDALASFNPNKA